MEKEIKLKIENINKSFPGVKALDNINFSVKKGSVHVLCGENGAGKSTLMKIINGIYNQDSGEIYIDGELADINSPVEAIDHGISMIFQELNYVPEMTVEENFVAGRWPTNKFGKVNWKKARETAKNLLEEEGLNYSLDTKLKNLTISDIQLLEISKAVSYDSDIIIMDEPTSAISDKEIEILFEKINSLRDRGKSVIYISHKMDEIFQIADEITVLRDGKVVATNKAEDLTEDKVVSMMVGRELSKAFPKEEIEIGKKIFEVRNLSRKGVIRDINFNVHRGEIVGFAGLVGAGRTEVMRSLFGLDEFDSGEIKIKGKNAKITNTSDSIDNGLVMLSEDRRRYGIVPVRSVRENITISKLDDFIYGGRLHAKKEKKVVEDMSHKLNIKTPSIETNVSSLSGGNQQKVILAKWLVNNPDVFLLDEPTRGIDVGAKYEIYKLMVDLAKEGKGIVMVSSELPELIGMCDRIYVMSEGTITGELSREEFSQKAIMKYAIGG
ncbi:monosaccharide ABC transporter ATP-binding protein (CUT2 family) [Halanaerobium saccharolyticum]|uniref:Monosaccharide ABC transporter ATP-binding protein (CUT2 family) n=1 Tax=Halanaerobium saccharolyticum TaxID=43595 RepID=A0A4R6L924_9FIRM|nr:sugar ABC transporter ATP-binding protein [Halanaerobium saccharolyticum]TDO70520.1 monosaccharide ABC transporter ATP-binding protein (CUT2 family) [Halanaerobium saccharolyticum]